MRRLSATGLQSMELPPSDLCLFFLIFVPVVSFFNPCTSNFVAQLVRLWPSAIGIRLQAMVLQLTVLNQPPCGDVDVTCRFTFFSQSSLLLARSHSCWPFACLCPLAPNSRTSPGHRFEAAIGETKHVTEIESCGLRNSVQCPVP